MQFGLDELADLVVGNLVVVGFREDQPQAFTDEVEPLGPALSRCLRRDSETGAPDRDQDSLSLQISIGPGDRVWIDGQLTRHFPHRRDMFTDLQRSIGDSKLDLPADLFVDRDSVGGFNMQPHGRLLLFYIDSTVAMNAGENKFEVVFS